MSFDLEWHINEQEFVYNNLFAKKQKKAEEEGLKPGKILSEGQGGYIVAARHPPHIVENMTELSQRIGVEVDGNAILFDESNLHTTLYVAPWESYKGPSFDEQVEQVEKLYQVVEDSFMGLKPAISYDRVMFDQEMAMAVGPSNWDFLEFVYRLQQATGAERARCSAHATLARFTKEMKPEELEGFYALMRDEDVMGESVIKTIDVAYFVIKPNSGTFDLSPYKTFEL